MARAGATAPATVRAAKNFIIGSFPLSIELPSDLATRLTTIFLYELGDNYLSTFRDRIAAVSAADVGRVSKDHLTTDAATIVLVGNAAQFTKSIESLGTPEIIAADNEADKQTVWIDKASRKVLKISAVIPSLNGAILTSELTP